MKTSRSQGQINHLELMSSKWLIRPCDQEVIVCTMMYGPGITTFIAIFIIYGQLIYMRTSRSQGRINHLELMSSLRPFYCHKPELSNIISKEVVHNYLALISTENILSGIDIKGTVTICICTIKGVFLFDPQFNKIFLVCLFVYCGECGRT